MNEDNLQDQERHTAAESEHAQKRDALNADLEHAQAHLDEAELALAELNASVAELAAQREQCDRLQHALDTFRDLEEHGLDSVFWGDELTPQLRASRLAAVENHIAEYYARVEACQIERDAALGMVDDNVQALDQVAADLFYLEEERQERLHEWVVERDEDPLPKLMQVMPWMRGFDEDRQFRKHLLTSFAVSALIGLIVPFVELPIPERDEMIEVPKRFAKFVEKRRAAPPPPAVQPINPDPVERPPEPVQEPEKVRPPEVKPKVAEEPEPAFAQQESAREKVASKGILAFRESFSNLAESRPSAKLGAQASISSVGDNSRRRPERHLISTQASGSSGGINLAAVSRNLGEGGGGAMAGVQTTQLESGIPGAGAFDRPLSAGAVAGRTDEEIQIVFDRYKAALYRLYNRELRKDPTLQGQIVLQLTIEPDGSVSLIEMRSSNLNAPELAQHVVSRVRAFDFGAKEVPAITIIYPIDFLPTA